MGERLQSPSLMDEYVRESVDGEDCVQASPQFVAKVADRFRADLNIPFTCRNNVATISRRIPDMHPNVTQTKDLINNINITRAIVYNPHEHECNCRYCPWCLHLTPYTCNSCEVCSLQCCPYLRRSFMDQGSQGMPRSLDSEILIEVDDVRQSKLHSAALSRMKLPMSYSSSKRAQQKSISMHFISIHQEKLAKDTAKNVDAYGEPDDYSNEYITVSRQSSTEPPALCLNTEEISKVFDEIMGYLIFQRQDILDDFLSLSFSEMKAGMNERRTPFTRR